MLTVRRNLGKFNPNLKYFELDFYKVAGYTFTLFYTKRTKVFQHLIISHTNNTKMGLFMKRVTSKRYWIQLIGFQIRIIRIQISHRLIFLFNHSFLTFCNYQSVPLYATYTHFDHYT